MRIKLKKPIYFSGSHRTGKSTTANLLKKLVNAVLLETSARKDALSAYALSATNLLHEPAYTQIAVQSLMLRLAHKEIIYTAVNHENAFIADRGLLDYAAYTMEMLSESEPACVSDYIKTMVDILPRDAFYIIMSPLPHEVPSDPKSAPNDRALMERIHNNVCSLAVAYLPSDSFIIVPPEASTIAERLGYILKELEARSVITYTS